LWVFKFFE